MIDVSKLDGDTRHRAAPAHVRNVPPTRIEPPARAKYSPASHLQPTRRSLKLLLAFVAAAGAAIVQRPSFATGTIDAASHRATTMHGVAPVAMQTRPPAAAARFRGGGVYMADAVAEEAAEAGETFEFEAEVRLAPLPRLSPAQTSRPLQNSGSATPACSRPTALSIATAPCRAVPCR